jgi:hypothetical protein
VGKLKNFKPCSTSGELGARTGWVADGWQVKT